MPTTQHPTRPESITYDMATDSFIGAARTEAVNPAWRVAQALRDRLAGFTWREVATNHGYRSAAVAEYNVGRYVAVLNGRTATRTTAGTALSMRRFGVEIEFVGCTMAAAARAMTDALGYDVSVNGYHSSRSYNAWRIERDGSVTHGNIGGEAVSSILSGPEGLASVAAVVTAIRAAGGRVNRTTGIHVHIDASDLTGEQIARLMCAYDDRQPAFDRMVAESRRTTSYRRSHYVGGMSVAEKAMNKYDLEQSRRAPNASRYRNVNVTNLDRTGTVEFRQHQGSLNGTKITAWVQTLLALTAAVVATEDEHLPTEAAELLEALTAHGLADTAARNITRRLAVA